MPTPLVSVVMPVHNAGPFLAPAVESLRAQTLADWELVAVDDASTDGSADALRAWARRDRRVRPFFQPANRGIPQTRNAALERARGPFIAFLNHDDLARPERLAAQVAFLERRPEITLLGSAIEHVDADGRVFARVPMPETSLEIRWMGLLDAPVRLPSAVLRRTAVTERGLRHDPTFPVYSDYEFLGRVARRTPAANLPAVLAQRRTHPRNTTSVRWNDFVANGVRIAALAIREELPEFAITVEEVAGVRAALFNCVPTGGARPLAALRRGVSRYLDLWEAFAARHRGHPELAAVEAGLRSAPPLAA